MAWNLLVTYKMTWCWSRGKCMSLPPTLARFVKSVSNNWTNFFWQYWGYYGGRIMAVQYENSCKHFTKFIIYMLKEGLCCVVFQIFPSCCTGRHSCSFVRKFREFKVQIYFLFWCNLAGCARATPPPPLFDLYLGSLEVLSLNFLSGNWTLHKHWNF